LSHGIQGRAQGPRQKKFRCNIIRMAQTHSNECYFIRNLPHRRDITIISPVSGGNYEKYAEPEIVVGHVPKLHDFLQKVLH